MESLVSIIEIAKNIGEWFGYLNSLQGNMQNLKRKIEYLSAQENDINAEISNTDRPCKRPRKEVEVWLRDVPQLKDDVQRLEQEVVGGRNVFSRVWLGKRIIEKIQEATELQEKGKAFNGLLVDEFPIRRLLMPPTKDFIESTEARNLERVWECLMNDEDTRIGVSGMGGVGKTTIMKHIHNRLMEETDEFNDVFWVTVSKAFNVTNLQRDIAKALNFSLSDDEDVTRRASQLYTVLSRQKRYVLILDDVWEAFPLERVGIPEPTRFNGCKLVLTTRSLEVCRRMECTTVKVELLKEQEALMLFLSKAVGHDTVLAPELQEIATEMAKECAKLPLAIVTVAGSVTGLKGTHDWRNALNELINSTKDVNDGESEVFEQLKFSYSRLGDKVLQDCFLYCSLYPEDYEIYVTQLIERWYEEGLIADHSTVQAKFDEGLTIVRKLTSTSLLESFIDKYGEDCVRMHDLVRDMALRITASSPRFIVKSGLHKNVPYEDWSEDLEKISVLNNHVEELPSRPPVCPRLTTLLLNGNELSVITNSFFTYMPSLKVLNLSHNKIKSLPESISNLGNLHALILYYCKQLEHVPSLEKLKALKVLNLTFSRIEEVPKGIEKLVNLRKLNLSYNERLGTFPSWKLRRLSKLQEFEMFRTRAEVSAKDLLELGQLKVVAVHLHNILELTKYVTSQRFQGLETYKFVVGKWPERMPPQGNQVFINFESETFGSGVDQLVLPNNINLLGLEGFHVLISLSAIPWLKDMRHLGRCNVRGCDGLESIFSSSSISNDEEIPLQTVESFYLSDLDNYRLLFHGSVPPRNISFNLKILSFKRCHSVKKIFPAQLLQNFPNLEELTVDSCENVEDIIFEEEMSDSNTITLPRLRDLILDFLPRLKSIYTGIIVCKSLGLIAVLNCPKVRRLPLSLHMDNNEKATALPRLFCIQGEEEWWESLEWDDPITKTTLEPFFTEEFIEVLDDELMYNSFDSIDLNKLPSESDDDLSSLSSD